MKDLWERFKAWWNVSDPFEDKCDRLIELHKQNKEREKEWIEACVKHEHQELRDRFAMAALTGFLANPSLDHLELDEWASDAYTLADAMLKARDDA